MTILVDRYAYFFFFCFVGAILLCGYECMTDCVRCVCVCVSECMCVRACACECVYCHGVYSVFWRFNRCALYFILKL